MIYFTEVLCYKVIYDCFSDHLLLNVKHIFLLNYRLVAMARYTLLEGDDDHSSAWSLSPLTKLWLHLSQIKTKNLATFMAILILVGCCLYVSRMPMRHATLGYFRVEHVSNTTKNNSLQKMIFSNTHTAASDLQAQSSGGSQSANKSTFHFLEVTPEVVQENLRDLNESAPAKGESPTVTHNGEESVQDISTVPVGYPERSLSAKPEVPTTVYTNVSSPLLQLSANSSMTFDRVTFEINSTDVIVFLHMQKTGGTTFGQHLVKDLQLERSCYKNYERKVIKRYKCLRPNSPTTDEETWLFSRYTTGTTTFAYV